MSLGDKMDSDAASDSNLFLSDEGEGFTEDFPEGAASLPQQQVVTNRMGKAKDTSYTEEMEMIDTSITPTPALEDIYCPNWERESMESADPKEVIQQIQRSYQDLVSNILQHSVPSEYKYQEKNDILDPVNLMKSQDTLNQWMSDIGITPQHYSSWPDSNDDRYQDLSIFTINKLSKSYREFMDYLKSKENTSSFSAALQEIFKRSNSITDKLNKERREIRGLQYFCVLYQLKLKMKQYYQKLKTDNLNAHSKVKRQFLEAHKLVKKYKMNKDQGALEINGEKVMRELYYGVHDFCVTFHQLYTFHLPTNLHKSAQKYFSFDMIPQYSKAQHFYHRFWKERMVGLLQNLESAGLPEPTLKVILD